jgi:protein-S-isoprenylcysteine O-methyltransferase Ste14
MGRTAVGLASAALLVAVVVVVDVLFFRDHPWPRLMVNLGIVLVVGAFYLRFLKSP